MSQVITLSITSVLHELPIEDLVCREIQRQVASGSTSMQPSQAADLGRDGAMGTILRTAGHPVPSLCSFSNYVIHQSEGPSGCGMPTRLNS